VFCGFLSVKSAQQRRIAQRPRQLRDATAGTVANAEDKDKCNKLAYLVYVRALHFGSILHYLGRFIDPEHLYIKRFDSFRGRDLSLI
jgi:hypothetical protein